MEYARTVKAAFLLKICPQRVRQLLAEGRSQLPRPAIAEFGACI